MATLLSSFLVESRADYKIEDIKIVIKDVMQSSADGTSVIGKAQTENNNGGASMSYASIVGKK